MLGMTLRELIDRLHALGLDWVQPYHVRYALSVRQIKRPPKDGAGRYLYDESHVLQAVRFLRKERV